MFMKLLLHVLAIIFVYDVNNQSQIKYVKAKKTKFYTRTGFKIKQKITQRKYVKIFWVNGDIFRFS